MSKAKLHQSSRCTVPQVGLVDGVQDLDTIMFLDFDGVLHRNHSHKYLAFEKLNVIEQVLAECPDIHIVACSDWRLTTPFEQLQGLLGPLVGSKLIGVTPDFLDDWKSRGDECQSWINTHSPHAHWVAVDDRPNWYQTHPGRVYAVTNPTLVQEDIPLLVAQLDSRLTNHKRMSP